jgi:hypothetical protein
MSRKQCLAIIAVTHVTGAGIHVASIRVSVTLALDAVSAVRSWHSVVSLGAFLAGKSFIIGRTVTLFDAARQFRVVQIRFRSYIEGHARQPAKSDFY